MITKFQGQMTSSFYENIKYMDTTLPIHESFDIIRRSIKIADKQAVFYFIDGFTKDETLLKILDSLYKLKPDELPSDATLFAECFIPHAEIDIIQDYDEIIRDVLSGITCLFIEGYSFCFAIDCRTYPSRNVDEPEKDKSLRGSRDGFVETIVFNTALIRRRIRDPHLIMEITEGGQTSRTDIAICYMKDRVNQPLLEEIKNILQNMQVDDLRMNQQSLAEAMFKRKWFNPFPKFKFSERPDTAAACILEGKVVILVDNSPSAMILPTSVFDMVEEANDYYFPKSPVSI